MAGKHIDFTQLQILDMEGVFVEVVPIEPFFRFDNMCECCGQVPVDYSLTSAWDSLRQCTVTQCQSCMVEQYNDPSYPDTYNFIA